MSSDTCTIREILHRKQGDGLVTEKLDTLFVLTFSSKVKRVVGIIIVSTGSAFQRDITSAVGSHEVKRRHGWTPGQKSNCEWNRLHAFQVELATWKHEKWKTWIIWVLNIHWNPILDLTSFIIHTGALYFLSKNWPIIAA